MKNFSGKNVVTAIAGIRVNALHVVYHMNQYADPDTVSQFMEDTTELAKSIDSVVTSLFEHGNVSVKGRDWLPASLKRVTDVLEDCTVRGYIRGEEGFRLVKNLLDQIDNTLRILFDCAETTTDKGEPVLQCPGVNGYIVLTKRFTTGISRSTVKFVTPTTNYIVVAHKDVD